MKRVLQLLLGTFLFLIFTWYEAVVNLPRVKARKRARARLRRASS